MRENDQHLLDSVPDYLSVGTMLKATPATEGAQRFIYLEASNEALDQQNEVVLAKALKDSAEYFLKFGNLDLDHYTQIGAKAGIPAYESYEIGRPVDVRVDGNKTFVKGHIYSGSGSAAERANLFWSSITDLNPPARWYPSVGGAVLAKSMSIDPATKSRRALISKVRWTNIGFSKTPVNADLPTVSTVPFGALAKSWGALGLDLGKALEAGYGTDSATLSGGGALRIQSLDGAAKRYTDFRDRLSRMILTREVDPSLNQLVKAASDDMGVSESEALSLVTRFLGELKQQTKRGKA